MSVEMTGLIHQALAAFMNPLCFLFGHKFKMPFRMWYEVDGRMKRKVGTVDTKYCCRCGARDDRDNRSSTA